MSPQTHDHAPVADPRVLDPVCGMTISPGAAAGHLDYQGHTYYFCGKGCLERFRTDPTRFVVPQPEPAAAAVADPEAEYTCPMHPEIRQKGPGAWPILG